MCYIWDLYVLVVDVQPCYQAIRDWVMKHVGIIIGIGFGIVAIEVSSGCLAYLFSPSLLRNVAVSDTLRVQLAWTSFVRDKK